MHVGTDFLKLPPVTGQYWSLFQCSMLGTGGTCAPLPLPSPPPLGPSAHFYLGGGDCVQKRGDAPPPPWYHHIWFVGLPEILQCLQRVIFRQTDPISADVVPVVYRCLIMPPGIKQYA